MATWLLFMQDEISLDINKQFIRMKMKIQDIKLSEVQITAQEKNVYF